MKHILPILTLALLGAAATVSADNFYYDYYRNPIHPETPSTEYDKTKSNWYDTDSYTYGVSEENKTGDFTVARNSNWYSHITGSTKSNFFRIEVNKNDVQLYLTDFVSDLYADTLDYNSNTNALFNMNIVQYGYRTLTWDPEKGKYIPGETIAQDVFVDSEDGTGKVLNKYITPIDTIKNEKGVDVTRYKYSLGTTFGSDDIIELYMKDSKGGEVYSFSSYDAEKDEYVPFNPNEYKYIPTLQGGFGDGGYMVNPISYDDMLDSYYFDDAKLTAAQYTPFPTDAKRNEATAKAMPLSQLIPSVGGDVSFGIYATSSVIDDGNGGNGGSGNGGGSSGQPLPGGLSIALVAGLFGLGFWYIRRRKAVAA